MTRRRLLCHHKRAAMRQCCMWRCLLQMRVTAGLGPRSLSLALEAFPAVERLVLHDLNRLLLPVSCTRDADPLPGPQHSKQTGSQLSTAQHSSKPVLSTASKVVHSTASRLGKQTQLQLSWLHGLCQ